MSNLELSCRQFHWFIALNVQIGAHFWTTKKYRTNEAMNNITENLHCHLSVENRWICVYEIICKFHVTYKKRTWRRFVHFQINFGFGCTKRMPDKNLVCTKWLQSFFFLKKSWTNFQLVYRIFECADEHFRGDWFGTFSLHEACDNLPQQSRDTELLKSKYHHMQRYHMRMNVEKKTTKNMNKS